MASWVELTGDHARCEARVRGQHLVRGNHWEAITEDNDDRAFHPCQAARQHDMIGDRHPLACDIVVPVHTPQVARVGPVLVGIANKVGLERRRVRQLPERRQRDRALTEALDTVGKCLGVDDPVG